MLNNKQYEELLEDSLVMLKTATGPERAMCNFLVAILSEMRATRETNVELLKKFNQVTANGNVMLTEQA
jgi:hypothetical protein